MYEIKNEQQHLKMGCDADIELYDKDGNSLGYVSGKNGTPLNDYSEQTEYRVILV
jgi:hypothetical protein